MSDATTEGGGLVSTVSEEVTGTASMWRVQANIGMLKLNAPPCVSAMGDQNASVLDMAMSKFDHAKPEMINVKGSRVLPVDLKRRD